jgi:hypothetical protein
MFEANNFLREFISRLIYNPNVWVYELTNEQDVDSIDWSERFVQVIKEIDEVTPVMIDSGGFSDPLTWMNDTSIDIFQLHLYPSGGALFGKTGVDNGIHWDVHYNLMTGPKPWFLGESGGYNTHTPMGAPPSSAAGEYLSWDSIWFSLLNRTNASFIWGVEQFSITPFRMAAEICPLVDWKKLSEAKAKVAVAVPRDISNPYYFLTEEGRNALNVMADYTIWGLENGVTIDFPVDASGYDIQCSINSFTPPTITPPFDISTGYQFKYRMSESGDLVVGYLRNIDHIELWQPTTGINGSYIRIRVSTLAELDWNLPFSEYRLTVWDLDTEQKLENASLTDGIKGNWSLNNTDHDFVLMWNKIAIGNWLFDEGSGSAASDSSGNDNDGILQYLDPSTCWVDGKYGKAIKFENGGWVRCDSDPSLALETLTIEYWFKPSNWTGDAWQGTHLFKSGTGNSRPYWIYGARPGEKLTFVRIGDDGVYHALQSNKTNWDVNTFYHIVAQYDNSNGEWKIYVNGTLDNSQTLQITPSTTEGYLYIGLWTFDGVIDELKIYNTILSASEIYQHYQGQ